MFNKLILCLVELYSSIILKTRSFFSLLLLLLLFSFSHLSYAQFDRDTHTANDPEPCATDIIHQRKLIQDAEYRANYEKMNKELREYIENSSNQRREGNLIIIPLVVHIMHTGGPIGSIYNPTDAKINDMIAYLNQMYRNQAPFNTAGGVDIEIQFELAQRTPNCTLTNGINRVDASIVPGYAANGISTGGANPGVPELQIKNLSRWSNIDYYNIWIVNKLNGADGTVGSFTAGYAYFPGAGADVDGTVMLATQIDPGEITLPHEIGHALRLSHTFQGSTGAASCPPNADCATQGDFVCDTAPHNANHFQCTSNTCAADLTVLENIMSYSGCQDKFTLGQKTRMRIALETQRPGLISSLGGIPPPASLAAVACIPTTGTPSFSGIERVRFNTIDVNSGAADDEGSYVDRSCGQGTTVLAGSTHELRVNSYFLNSHKVRAYIDYNNDGDFNDVGEEVLTSNSGTEHITNVVIPTTGVPFNQPLRMRVVGDFQGNVNPTACTVDEGQAEDFSIIIESNQPCNITAITAGTQTACNPTTNSYTQQVTVTYANPPSSGNLVVNGQEFPLTTSPQTVTLVGLNSDGLAVDVTASFSANGTCPFTATTLFTAPTACEPRITLGTITTTTYCAGETIIIPYTAEGIFNVGNTFTAQLSSAGGIFTPAIATGTGASPISITIPTTAANGTGYKIRVFSSTPSIISANSSNLTINAIPLDRTIIAIPNTVNTGQSSDINIANSQIGVSYQLQNVTTGNTNVGTPVAGTGGIIALPTGSLTATTDFRVVATNLANCERILNTTRVNVVIPCTISAITQATQTACNPATNTYSQQLIITYTTPPATGNLVVNGQSFPITTSPQTVTLTGLTANGNPVDVTASFSANAACTFTQNNAFTAPVACSNTIVLGTINPTTYCAGDVVSIPYTIQGTFGATNTFTAQLSTANGSFDSPLAYATGTSPILMTLPVGLKTSANYRIRVVSSSPALVSSISPVITINALPTAKIINSPSFYDWDRINVAGGLQFDEVRAMTADAASNMYISGYFMQSINFGATTLSTSGDRDIFIAKYDPVGTVLWAKKIGGTSVDIGRNMIVDEGGNLYVTASFQATIDVDGTSISSTSGSDVLIAKFDTNGNLIWTTSIGGSSLDESYDIAIDTDYNVYITGGFTGNINVGATTLNSSGSFDIFLAKYSFNGTPLWAKKAGGSGDDRAISMDIDATNTIYIGGWFSTTSTFETTSITSTGSVDAFVAKYDSDGNFEWVTSGGSTDGDRVAAVLVQGQDLYVAGSLSNNALFGSTTLTSNGGEDGFVAKYSTSTPTLQWIKAGGGTGNDQFRALAFESNTIYTGGFATAGGTIEGQTIPNAGSEDAIVLGFSSGGNFAWLNTGGGAGQDFVNALSTNNKSNLYASGFYSNTATFGINTVSSNGSYDLFAATLVPELQGCEGVNLEASRAVGNTYQWLENNNPILGATNQDYFATTAGSYSVNITNAATCTNVSGVLKVLTSPLPNDIIIVASPATIAPNASSNIEIPNSQTTVNYQLQDVSNGNANIGTPQTGTGGTLSIPTGNLTSTTDFRVVATNPLTGCERILNTVTVMISSPEINVVGNSVSIVSGDITPSLADDTDFGSILTCAGSIQKIFTIQNTGTLDLEVTDISVTGTDFTFPLPTFPFSIAAGDSQDIVLTFDPSTDGTQTQTITILSNDNDEATYTFDIKGIGEADTENPTITAPANVTVNADAGICTASGVILGTATGNDNCGTPTITDDAPVSFPIGTTNVVWTATDAAGNTASATQIVTVLDTENPTITVADVNVSCPADVVLGTPTTNDNCGVNTTINDAPTTFPYGITTVTWTVTDVAGNTATATQTVTVSDTQNPTISTPADIAVGCPQNVVLVPPTINDNCTVASLTNDAPTTFPQGTTTVTWTVTDEAGNTATSTNTVTVNDVTNPTITAPADLNLSCTETVILGNPITNDDCGVATVTNDAPTTYPLGMTTITWTVTDNSGNTATATQRVTVSDTQNPTITAPLSVVVETDAGICTASNVVLGTPTTADNCGVATVTNNAPAIFPLGTTNVIWTVTDNAGNTATATQPITVLDRINPTMANPAPVNLLTDIGACTATNNLTAPATSDNCTVESVVNNAPTAFPIGTTIVTWTATDAAGNTVSKIQTVNVTRDPFSVRVTISSPDTVICTNETTRFTATGATSYVFYKNGVEVSTSATYEPPIGTFQNGDQIWVIGQTNSCPDTTRKMTVIVNDLPSVDLGVDKFKCSTDTAFLVAPTNTNYIYDWKKLDATGTPISVGNGNDTLFVTNTGTYFVNVTNTLTGCSNTSNTVKVLNYDDQVVVSLGEDKTICEPADLPYRLVGSDLSHLAGTTYEWYVAGTNTIIGTDSVLDVTAENTYSVVVQDPRGCRISDTVRINFTPTPDFVITGHENPNCSTFDTLRIERTNVRNMTINWFGNGIVSLSDSNKVAIVNVSGIYTATVTDNNTDANCTYSQSVEVFVRPNINLGVAVTSDTLRLCEGDSLVLDAFRPEHNNNFIYQWRVIETNQVVSTNSKIAINYEMVNNYTSNRFEVKVTDPNLTGGGSCSVLDTIIVRFDRKTGVQIEEDFIKTLCLGQSQTLTATGADAYTWSNGATSSTIEITPTEAGFYTFIVNGTFRSPNLCGASADTIRFRVVNVPELAVPETLVICEGDSVEVDAFLPSHEPRYIYEWTNETTGEIIDTLALHVFKQDSANITYQPQTFKVGVYDTLGGGRCGIESLITVTFSRSATPTITASDTLVCVGEEITLTAEGATNFRWNTGETTKQITVSSDSAGIFRYTVLGSYGDGQNVCDSVGTSILVQFKDVPTIKLNQKDTVSICAGDSIQFIASGGASYAWSHTPAQTGDTVVVYPTDTTMYVVTGFDTLGCSSTDTVVVLTQPQIDLGADQQLCKGDTTIIGAPRPFGATYLWSTGATTDSIIVTFGGKYYVEVKINECSYTDSVTISYIDPPQLVAKDTILCFEDEQSRLIFHELGVKIRNYDSTARYRYQWLDESGEIVGQDSLLKTEYGGNYLVRVTAEYETSCNAMTSLVVRASCEPELYIPSAFTPNNDNLNEEWELFGRYYANLRVRVVDRWGMVMYESYIKQSSDPMEFWNGQYKGKQVPSGIYYYEITYTSPTDNSKTIKRTGAVTVMY